MANTLTSILAKVITRGLPVLREAATMVRVVNSSLSAEAAKPGQTIDVPIPVKLTTSAVVPAATPPTPASVTMETVKVDLTFHEKANFHLTDKEMVEIDKDENFMPLEMGEAMRALGNRLNETVFAEYPGIYGYVGTAGTTPYASDVKAATDARKVLNKQLCPKGMRIQVLDFDAEANALALSQFSDFEKTGDRDVKIAGELGTKFGMRYFSDDQVPTHTTGAAGTALVDDAAAVAVGVKTIHMDGFTTKPSVGDVFTIAGDTQTYTVTAATDLVGTDSDVSFEPGLKVALPTGDNNEAVTFKASHIVNLAFHPDAFAFAMRPLLIGRLERAGGTMLAVRDDVTGMTFRLEILREYKQTVWEIDALWGVKLVRPELAVRIAG